MTGYRLGFADAASARRNLAVAQLKSMEAIANPSIQDAVAVTAGITEQADQVSDPGAEDSGRSDLLFGSTGLFDWAKTLPVTAITSCEGTGDYEGNIVGFQMTFGEGSSAQTQSLGA